ncbi:energy-coupling factor transport system permease protein [Clostridium cavendishii DSM 21758]|uniref:Energy-coupling factor transport system permease protein n=1 Tax=Clostridium cavendishii DSM 21758 TaxID=1121302 RepID=A0A1M6J0J8_9CLOT|nr:energy-coupling factor transporter transmembrane component T [Clostridium cavendishii]SHJ40211.1 energy-coupling factor transport system permease protein [Clostridium cavendishii DSM 21758]
MNEKTYHVLTPIIVFILMLSIIFSTDNFVIIITIILFNLLILKIKNQKEKIKNSLIYFLPFALLIILFNCLFVTAGSKVLFEIFDKVFTLEALIYGAIMSGKLYGAICTFFFLDVLVDSDKAVSYFSHKLPKSTLLIMVGVKLIPNLKERFERLKEIYILRGIDFNEKSKFKQVKNYMPLMLILLEDTLDQSFIIGEGAYVRGFLSNRRTYYMKEKFEKQDFIIITLSLATLSIYLISCHLGYMKFDIYSGVKFNNCINLGVSSLFLCFNLIFIIMFLRE